VDGLGSVVGHFASLANALKFRNREVSERLQYAESVLLMLALRSSRQKHASEAGS
jgi:hypothetical protein